MRNWQKYQHYKGGKNAASTPPWIKLYTRLLTDPDFEPLPDVMKWHAIGIFLLAATTENKMLADPAWLARKIGAHEPIDVNSLVSAGIVERYVILGHDTRTIRDIDLRETQDLRGEGKEIVFDIDRYNPGVDG